MIYAEKFRQTDKHHERKHRKQSAEIVKKVEKFKIWKKQSQQSTDGNDEILNKLPTKPMAIADKRTSDGRDIARMGYSPKRLGVEKAPVCPINTERKAVFTSSVTKLPTNKTPFFRF